ncbi:MAG: 2OG-Fe(II) oxygenase [Candidatus Sericytochromatia bacterium]
MPLPEISEKPDPHSRYLVRYVSLPGFLSPAECQRLISSEGAFHQAKVVALQSGDVQLSLNERKTDTKSIEDNPETHWIYQRLRETLVQLNRQTFRFELKRFSAPEILRYEPSGFYAPHSDLGQGETSSRKLSAVALLSPPESYSGGELVFYPRFAPCSREQGTLFLFPAYLMHEVKPVSSGQRYTLVTWVHGPCLR